MNVGFTGKYTRCVKNFTKLPIIPKLREMNTMEDTKYFVFSKDKKDIIGSFNIANDGYISNLKIAETVRRKKTASDAILSIKDFVIKKAKEHNLDFIRFYADYKNRNNLVRLYKHLGADNVFSDTMRGHEFVGILNLQEKSNILRKFKRATEVKFQNAANSIIAAQKP